MLTTGISCASTLPAGKSVVRRPVYRKPSRTAALPVVAESRREVISRTVNAGTLGALFIFGRQNTQGYKTQDTTSFIAESSGDLTRPTIRQPAFATCQHPLLAGWDHSRNAAEGIFPDNTKLQGHKMTHWLDANGRTWSETPASRSVAMKKASN